jgi:hypothetical protein
MAGMLTARVLADHFDRVTVLERGRFPETPAPRKGLPQARHAHALLARGREVLEQLLPGLTHELLEAGASLYDLGEAFAWLTPFGWGPRFRPNIPLLSQAPGREDAEGDEPEGRVLVGPVQLVEVCLPERAGGDEGGTKEVLPHLTVPRGRPPASVDQGCPVMPDLPES